MLYKLQRVLWQVVFAIFGIGSIDVSAGEICGSAFSNTPNSSLQLQNLEIQVAGARFFSRILYLTEVEYKMLANQEALLPIDLVVIDSFPTELEPQVIAGIVSRTRLRDGCHAVRGAEAQGIPVVFDPNWTANVDIIAARKDEAGGIFSADKNKHTYTIQRLSAQEARKQLPELPSVEQRPIDRNFIAFNGLRAQAAMPLNLRISRYGEKVAKLSEGSKEKDNDHFPEILGVPFGFYFAYIERVEVKQKQTLAQFIADKVFPCAVVDCEPQILKENLASVREQFLRLDFPPDLWTSMIQEVEKTTIDIFQELRIRTSNDVEDRLGAGLYDSIIIPKADPTKISRREREQQISLAMRQAAASLYSFRAFQTRRLFQLSEKNVAMAWGVHRSINNQSVTGVATFTLRSGIASVEFVAYPSNGSGTSPRADSPFQKFTLEKGPDQRFRMGAKGRDITENFQSGLEYGEFASYVELLELMQPIYEGWELPRPGKLGFEWVFVPADKRGANSSFPIIMQIKTFKDDEKPISPDNDSTPSFYRNNKILLTNTDAEVEAVLSGLRSDLVYTYFAALKMQIEDPSIKDEKLAYFLINIKGQDLLLVAMDKFIYEIIKQRFSDAKIDFELIAAGTLSFEAKELGDRFSISNIALGAAINRDVDLSDRDAKADLKRLMDALTASGLIALDSKSPIEVTDPRFLP